LIESLSKADASQLIDDVLKLRASIGINDEHF
jgi:hypothetical protein